MDNYKNKTIVSEENGSVIKTYLDDGGINLFMAECVKKMPNWMSYLIREIIYNRRYPDYPEVIKGVARLSFDDEWNEETGKRVAESKLAKKTHERVAKQAKYAKAMFEETIVYLDKIIDFHEKKVAAIQKDYNRYFMGEE